MSRSRKKLVPQCSKALELMKYEIAAEIGLLGGGSQDFNSEFADELGGSSQGQSYSLDWGSVSSRQNGYIGGSITKRLVQQAEQTLYGLK